MLLIEKELDYFTECARKIQRDHIRSMTVRRDAVEGFTSTAISTLRALSSAPSAGAGTRATLRMAVSLPFGLVCYLFILIGGKANWVRVIASCYEGLCEPTLGGLRV